MIKDTTLTVNIPAALKDLLCNHFKTSNISEAINKGLLGFLAVSSYAERMDDFAIHQLLSIEERRDMVKRTIRVPQKVKRVVNGYTSVDTSYTPVTVILANFLYFSGAVPALTLPPERNFVSVSDKNAPINDMHLLRLLGSKWNPTMQSAIAHILQTSSQLWATSIEPFAGALGIFSNFRVAFHEIINDIDLHKANLYRVIKHSYDDLLLGMLCQSITQETFDKNRKELQHANLSNQKLNIDAGINFLFSNLMSLRNGGYSYKTMSGAVYKKRLDAIAPLHERLKDTEICGLHALEIIEQHMTDEGIVFIVDPPYLDTNVYEATLVIDKKYDKEKRKFGYKEHEKLAKLLRKTHQQYRNDFILFCRVTVTRKHDQKTKRITNYAELDSGDRHMQGRIDDLFWGYNFYYVDVPYDKDGTVERIITSFNFNGATLYGKEVR